MDRLYIDTNIVVDIVRDRGRRSGQDFATPALSLFSRASAGDFELVISDWMLEELEGELGDEEWKRAQEIFARAEDAIVDQSYSEEDKKKSRNIGGHWHDALHGVLAEKAGADCIVTRDIDDFKALTQFNPRLPSYI